MQLDEEEQEYKEKVLKYNNLINDSTDDTQKEEFRNLLRTMIHFDYDRIVIQLDGVFEEINKDFLVPLR